MLLYHATNEEKYLEKAIEFADQVSKLQFTDWQRPLQNCYGMFYEFENNDKIFTVEWNQDHGWHMGYIEPTNFEGIIDLIKTCSEHPNVASWYNMVKMWGDGFAKQASMLNPLGIHPLTCYPGAKEKICFFKRSNHGFTGMYGQIAAFFFELGYFLNDPEYQNLAVRNIEFVVGLNPGFPNRYEETQWEAMSLIKGIGEQSFGGATGLHKIPKGSGMNGFSATPQFDSKLTPYDIPDAPKGILKPNNSFYFNEDYLPSSHGYVRGCAFLEDECSLSLQCFYGEKPIQCDVSLSFLNGGVHVLRKELSTDREGRLCVASLPVGEELTWQAEYNGIIISENVFTLSGRRIVSQIDFSNYVNLDLESPEIFTKAQTQSAQLRISNLGDSETTVRLFASTDGVNLINLPSEIRLLPNEKKQIKLEVVAGRKVMPYLIYIKAVSGKNTQVIISSGKIGR